MTEEVFTTIHITLFYTPCRSCNAISDVDYKVKFCSDIWSSVNDYVSDELYNGLCPTCESLRKKPERKLVTHNIAKAGISIRLVKDKWCKDSEYEDAKDKVVDIVFSFARGLVDHKVTQGQLENLIAKIAELRIESDYSRMHRVPYSWYARVIE